VSLLDLSLKGVGGPRIERKDGRLRLVASLSNDGLQQRRRHERIPVTRLNARHIKPGCWPMRSMVIALPAFPPPSRPGWPSRRTNCARGAAKASMSAARSSAQTTGTVRRPLVPLAHHRKVQQLVNGVRARHQSPARAHSQSRGRLDRRQRRRRGLVDLHAWLFRRTGSLGRSQQRGSSTGNKRPARSVTSKRLSTTSC
jgi:hypothetical protein